MNPAHIYIIAMCAVVGLGLALGSLWKGFVYTLFTVAALAFWWAVWLVAHALFA